MPTAAKLVAAILFGALAWPVSQMIRPLVPDATHLGRFSELNALIGAVVGWQVAGGRAGTSWINAVANGLTAALGTAATALLIHSLMRMLARSFRRVYEGPMEALLDVIRIMIDNMGLVLSPAVLGPLLLGGILAGLVTEWFARNYR
jgi:hypothetical protein